MFESFPDEEIALIIHQINLLSMKEEEDLDRREWHSILYKYLNNISEERKNRIIQISHKIQ